jgi:glycosyltransferase involved in cell wall biosynthesis
MASGLPILATRIHCHTDVIRNGKYVFWAEGAEVEDLIAALRIAWNNRVSLAQMGAESARAAQQFTWHESAKKLKNALEYGLVTDL